MTPTEDDFRLVPETGVYLSTRTQNALLRGGFFTAEQIMLASAADLMKLKGFGVSCLHEVAAWRDALMEPDPRLYREMFGEVAQALRNVGSIVAETQAPYVMATVWRVIARGPFTAARIRQLLIAPDVQS
jgi:hypothetical protein